MRRLPLALSPPGPRGHPATPYLARQRPNPKAVRARPELPRFRRQRWHQLPARAHAAIVGMIPRTLRRTFSRGCSACRVPMTRPMLSRIGRIATKGTAARSKAVRPMKQTGGDDDTCRQCEYPIRPTNAFQPGCRCIPLVERDCQEASRLPQMTQPLLCS